MTDNRKLLSIFLAEVCTVGLDYVEKLRYDCAYTSEMNRSAESAEFLCEDCHVHERGKSLMIHFRRLRIEDNIAAVFFNKLSVAVDIAGVAFEVLSRSELHRIYKIRYNGSVVVPV